MEIPVLRKITLRVRGEEFEATIERIAARAADERSPWRKEDELYVWLSFDQNKHPGSTLGFGVTLPVKDYKPDELLALIKREGERELEAFAVKGGKDRIYNQAKETRQKELDRVASRIANSLKEGGYSNDTYRWAHPGTEASPTRQGQDGD